MYRHCKKKIAFLDRDGIINEDNGYVHKLDELVWVKGVINGLRNLIELNYKLYIVTNQSGIARGYYTEKQFHDFMKGMFEKLLLKNIYFLGYDYCPHHPEGLIKKFAKHCTCRKPGSNMIEKALKKERIEAKNCILIGDKLTDIEAGIRANIGHLFLLNTNKNSFNQSFHHFSDWEKLSQYLNNKSES